MAESKQNGTSEKIYKVIMSIAGLCAPVLLAYTVNISGKFDTLNEKVTSLEVGQAVMTERLDRQTRMRADIDSLNQRNSEMQAQIHRLELLIRDRETRVP